MRVVVDTNIVFSAVLNSSGKIGKILFESFHQIDFFAPSFIETEIQIHKDKLIKFSSLSEDQVILSIHKVFKNIQVIPKDEVPLSIREKAYRIDKGVDEKDTPFIALALALQAELWTGDKRLIRGLKKKGFNTVLNTNELDEKLKSG